MWKKKNSSNCWSSLFICTRQTSTGLVSLTPAALHLLTYILRAARAPVCYDDADSGSFTAAFLWYYGCMLLSGRFCTSVALHLWMKTHQMRHQDAAMHSVNNTLCINDCVEWLTEPPQAEPAQLLRLSVNAWSQHYYFWCYLFFTKV